MKKKPIILIVAGACAVAAIGVAGWALGAKAFASEPAEEAPAEAAEEAPYETPAEAIPAGDPADYQGIYLQVNNDLAGDIISLNYNEEGLTIFKNGLYDMAYGYNGPANNATMTANGVEFETTLKPMHYLEGDPHRATVTLQQEPSGLYRMTIVMDREPASDMERLPRNTRLYKSKEARIEGTVPAKLEEPVTMASVIKAVTPYMFVPEMLATRMYLRDPDSLSENETVRLDERNRFLAYACPTQDLCMDCKYWDTGDGRILLMINTHDTTYQYPQNLRFMEFDKKGGTMREVRTIMSKKWPCGEEGSDNGGITYQVRPDVDGIVALVPQRHGDSFDKVTLKLKDGVFE